MADGPVQDQPATPAPSDQLNPADSPNPGSVITTPAQPAVDPIFHDPSKMDPKLRPFAAEVERRMYGDYTKKMQKISGQTKILEQLEAAKSNPQVARMFAEEIMRLHGQELPGPGSAVSPGQPDDSVAIPEEALADPVSLGKHIDQRIGDKAERLVNERTNDLQAQRNADQRVIRSLEGRLNKEAYPLYSKYEADIDELRDRNPNLTTDQAYQLATAEEREYLTQQRHKAESDERVKDAEGSFSELDTSGSMVEEDIGLKKGDDLETVFNKIKAHSTA